MSILNTIRVKLGLSNTPANNFTLTAEADNGTGKLARGNPGATTQDIITWDAAGLVTLGQGRQLTRGTAVSTTSGSDAAFLGIPSWVKRITVVLSGVSVTSTVVPLIQLGTSSGLETTGYAGTTFVYNTTAHNAANVAASGFDITLNISAVNTHSGRFVLDNIAGNTWVISGTLAAHGGAGGGVNGTKTLAGTLDRISLVLPTTAFDGGTVNVLYEG